MKKSLKFFLPILALSSTCLFACKKDEDKKAHLTYGDIHMAEEDFNLDLRKLDSNYKYKLTYDQFVSKLEDKNEDFILAIANEGCQCWTSFSPVLNQYCKETKTICYTIELDSIINQKHQGIKIKAGCSSFAIFKNGSCKYSLCSNRNQNEMYDYDNFKEVMEKNVILPKMIYIDEPDYLGKIYTASHTSDAVVYIKRSGCGDCQRIEPSILKPYFDSHSDSKVMYVLDCQKYYKQATDPDYSTYVDKKAELGMADPIFGYDNGKFPFFVCIKDGMIKSAASAYNETVDSTNKLTGTYYTEQHVGVNEYTAEVLEGKQLNSNEVLSNQSGKSWKPELQDATYKTLIESFLNYSFSQVTPSL